LWPAVVNVTPPLATPVPESVPPFDGEYVNPLSGVRFHVAETAPVAVGEKLNTISQEPPAAMLVPQFVALVNSLDPVTLSTNGYADDPVFLT
jgi:hypothetical protein